MLPLPAAITSQLDKASIIRLTISYLKLRDFSSHGDPPWSRDAIPSNKTLKGRNRSNAGVAMDIFEQHQGTHILQSLDGFALALAADGRFLYISETVSIYLGLSQVEMTGSSVFDYIHHMDHAEMAEQLGLSLTQNQQHLASPGSSSEDGSAPTGTNNPDVSSIMTLSSSHPYRGLDRAFCVRMKSTLTKRGCHFKSSGYRVVLMLCRLRPQYSFSHNRKSQPPLLGMVALAIALPPPSVHEIRLENDMFVTRINFDFRIAHCEPKVADLLDYTADEITGRNLYTLCHGEDANKLRKSHIDLINKGQVLTHYYRLMNKRGGYTWMQTCATVVCNSKNVEEQNIICVNYVLSGREYENLIMDRCQLEESSHTVKHEDTTSGNNNEPENGSPDADQGDSRTSGPATHTTSGDASQPPIKESSGGNRHNADGNCIAKGTAASNASIDESISGSCSHRLPKQLQSDVRPHDLRNINRRSAKRKNSSSEEEELRDADVRLTETNCQSNANLSGLNDMSVEDRDKEGNIESSQITSGNECSQSRITTVMSPESSCHSSVATQVVTSDSSVDDPSPRAVDEPTSVNSTNSVKDLEHAMSKHLPSCKSPTDFSTDTLLKQRSTIQWIGTHQQQGHTPLPATALLRQLYANRESVIRANVHGNASSTIRHASTCSNVYYANSDAQLNTLPTPPSSADNSSLYGETQQHQSSQIQQSPQHQTHSHHPTTQPSSFLLSAQHPNYTEAAAVAVAAAAAAVATLPAYSMDYHTAITPPSSVSPREKHHTPNHIPPQHSATSTFDTYQEVLARHQYNAQVAAATCDSSLPLKPQLYTYLDQSQFYHHHGTTTSAAATATGFHLYHHAAKTSSATAGSWYTPN